MFDGPINGIACRARLDQQLPATLTAGNIGILDNLGSTSRRDRRAIRPCGARLWYLPAYFADLNPIEHSFAKIKH